MNKIRIGTCSWIYDSWRGIVYPETGRINYLSEYAKMYNTVEIDRWFWSLGKNKASLPKRTDVIAYAESVPEDFLFSLKMPNSITLTHYYKKDNFGKIISNPYFLSNELLDTFLSNVSEMNSHLGPMMFQFEYLNKQKMTSQMRFQELFSSFIRSAPKNYKWAVEIRNPNYLNKSFFEFCQSSGLIPVLLEGYYMPPIVETYNRFEKYFNNTVVIRLHGKEREKIETATGNVWNRIVFPKDDDIRGISEIIIRLFRKGVDVYLNVNNHYEGSAPITISKFMNIFRNAGVV